MTEIQISESDIRTIADELGNLQLSPGQRALLSAIVAVAARAVVGQLTEPDPPLKEQFARAFTPGQAELLVKMAHITKGP